MNAKLVIITGRKRSARAFDRGILYRFALASLFDGELDNQNAVFGSQRHQHHEADLRIDIEARGPPMPQREIAPSTATVTDSSTGTGMFQLS